MVTRARNVFQGTLRSSYVSSDRVFCAFSNHIHDCFERKRESIVLTLCKETSTTLPPTPRLREWKHIWPHPPAISTVENAWLNKHPTSWPSVTTLECYNYLPAFSFSAAPFSLDHLSHAFIFDFCVSVVLATAPPSFSTGVWLSWFSSRRRPVGV